MVYKYIKGKKRITLNDLDIDLQEKIKELIIHDMDFYNFIKLNYRKFEY